MILFNTITLVKALQLQSCIMETFIVVVDNNSPNNSYVYLKPLEKEFDNVTILQTGKNLDFFQKVIILVGNTKIKGVIIYSD
jgi:hypothetical protein